jgi:hypothetical protein
MLQSEPEVVIFAVLFHQSPLPLQQVLQKHYSVNRQLIDLYLQLILGDNYRLSLDLL